METSLMMAESSSLPQRLDVSLVESELKALWRQIAQEREGNDEEVLRACVVNLVVCSSLDEEVELLASDLAASGDSQPGRLILLLTDETSSRDGFDARVSVHCQRQQGGRKQICGQIIRIVVHGEAADRGASVVPPLLVPDLPVFLWWRRSIDLDSALLRRLARISDRLVVDSARSGIDDLLALSQLMECAEDLTFADLAWARLQVWRRALAGLYDSGLTREVLTRPTVIRLDFGARAYPPNEVVYLLSWLASRLGWELRSSLLETDFGYRLDGHTAGSDLAIELHRTAGKGLYRMQLFAAGHLAVQLERRDSNGTFLETWAERQGRRLSHQILPVTSQQEIDLLAAELEIPGKDQVFQEALAFASRRLA
jgi:glucose-6-phosphate dehydrogenase assembly protein OpcA